MIKYSLHCNENHQFEGWFRSSDDCDKQISMGFVDCPLCGSSEVSKSLMAPAVSTSREKSLEEAPATQTAPNDTLMTAGDANMIAALKEMRDTILKNAEDVGDRFADEARKIHKGEAEARGIYGKATQEDVKSLNSEGVACLPLPVLPAERN